MKSLVFAIAIALSTAALAEDCTAPLNEPVGVPTEFGPVWTVPSNVTWCEDERVANPVLTPIGG